MEFHKFIFVLLIVSDIGSWNRSNNDRFEKLDSALIRCCSDANILSYELSKFHIWNIIIIRILCWCAYVMLIKLSSYMLYSNEDMTQMHFFLDAVKSAPFNGYSNWSIFFPMIFISFHVANVFNCIPSSTMIRVFYVHMYLFSYVWSKDCRRFSSGFIEIIQFPIISQW